MASTSWRMAALVFLVALAGAGCGRSTGEVSGTVTYKDKPLAGGTVMLLASDGRPYDSPIGPDGSYRIQRVPVGPARVAVTSPAPRAEAANIATARTKTPRPSKDLFRQPTAAPDSAGTDSLIPLNYGDFTQSALQIVVLRGPNRYDIPLK